MASYKSHYNPPRRTEEQTPYSHRTPTTRLPQRSITPTATTPQVPAPGPSKLQKRRPSRDEVHGTRGVTGQKAPTPKAPVALGSRQGSATSTEPIVQSTPRLTGSKLPPQSSSSRLPKLEVPPTNTRTPSLVSGSSASTIDSPRSNLLRRKQTSIGSGTGKQEQKLREDSMTSPEAKRIVTGIPGFYRDPFSETVLGISLPATSTILARSEAELDLPEYPHHEHELGPTDVLPPPVPHYALSTTPSTRYSESPGPFSVSSTPTSMSSYSPGVALSTQSTVRTRQVSPLQGRPPVVRYGTSDERPLQSIQDPEAASSSAGGIRGKNPADHLPASRPNQPLKTTQTSLAASQRRPETSKVQAPPELAHLADQPVTTTAPRKPMRPSRDGTPEITGFRGPSPVIQSNMMSFPSSHRRTTSTESNASAAMNSRSRFGLPHKPSSRNPSPNPSLGSGVAPPSRVPTRGPTPDLHLEKQRSQTVPEPAPAPIPSKTSRFGFFSRRTKTEPAGPVTKPEQKTHRRGPAAGTGHEGYGRYAVKVRNGSAASGSSVGKSPSAATTPESLDHTPSTRKGSFTSTTSTEMDDFFLERLNPVVIRGTGSSTELTRSPDPLQSTSSLDVSSPRLSQAQTATNNSSRSDLEGTRPGLLPSAMSDSVHGMSPVKKMPLGLRRPSESEDEMKKSFIPSLAARRASRTSKIVDATPSTKKASSKLRKASVSGAEGKEGHWLKYSKKEKTEQELSKPPRKWNFFQRAQVTPRVPTPAIEPSSASPARLPISRSVAHYAIVDDQAELGPEDIAAIMQEADSTPEEASAPDQPVENEVNEPERMEKERLPSMLLPPKPVLPNDFAPPTRPASPKVYLRPMPEFQPKLTLDTSITEQSGRAPPSVADLTPVTDLSPTSSPISPPSPIQPSEPVRSPQRGTTPAILPSPPATLSPSGPPPSNPPPRPSRLAQVGRIPQVISSRGETRRPPSRSFSRPFTANQPGSIAPPRTSFDSIAPVTATAGPAEPYPILHGLNALTHGSAIATMSPSAEESVRQGEFFVFPSRKGSEVSYSSSSGAWSFPATAGTAVVPLHGAPTSEDEVWNEYDDLIDEVLSPIDGAQPLSGLEPIQKRPSLEPLPLRPKHSRASSHSAVSATGISNPSLHLRRSRLLAVLYSQSPTSSVSLSDFLQEYGERNISVVDPLTGRLSFPSTAHMSVCSGPLKRAGSNRSSLPASLNLSSRPSKATLASTSDKHRSNSSANRYRDTRLMEMAETQADGLSSMANLRFGALMTSKWLSFGRVIFSPAHFELKAPEHDRVLVIDGLGKDWSYYCALTYPEATVYNLGPGQPPAATSNINAPEPWSTLNNHRHFNQNSLGDPFPFPKGYFACVVLRFPSALPTSVHRSVISECKRVLRPGGYLELSVLDLDLINMGNRARRAVRGLKVKMQVADEDVSLRNISDEIMGLVGRKGFTECNRCFVGVPVAGTLPCPDDSDAAASKKRKGSTASSITRTPSTAVKGMKQPKPEVSFSDLLNTRASSESTDNTITAMVARVGRWWYSRCYESLVLPEAGEPDAANSGNLLQSSIWRDEALLAECEKRGTSFRLLIGYAQKPEVGVRRTVSV
ncbi:hypothetical protein BU23DRAFT_458775 [Bimuria novae-zelandiae CBS 107.79]|uniref:Methyltransferase type 11 domain-containing protein n=1 Tax=Bimuria novae-zelandiae CBS 107.79 TaxID=1447943 RepID=A0A6A5VD73_9PLEO|nr:hypothetical protein BU23DRAFT_458775 [Bimuria novae-zelandiae CBS 107.79]